MKLKYLFIIPVLLLTSCQGKEPTSFKVVFDANGGSFNEGNTKEVTVEPNKPATPISEVPKHGNKYLFGHWFDNKECTGEAFNFDTLITHDTTLYARWLDNSGTDSDWDGLVDKIDPAKNDNTYTAHLIEVYPPVHIVNMPLTVNYTRFLGDETVFNHDLEQLGNVCAMDIYRESTTTLNGPSNMYKPIHADDDKELYLQLGCIDIEKHVFNSDQYAIDKFDTYTVMLAHHYFVKDGEAYEVLYVTNQGTDSEPEWYSDFDVGNDNDDYAHVTGVAKGKHTHWLNNGDNGTPIHHKGFDVATNRQFEDVIKPYINKCINKQAKLIIFNTGHSRGAAIGNLLGKKFNDEKTNLKIYKCFTYTYATPTTVYNTDGSNVPCPGVFNILNADDLVPALPLKSWDYYRYGTDKVYPVPEHKEEWKEFNDTIFSYRGPDVEGLTAEMYNMASSRDEIYSLHKTSDTMFTNETFKNKAARDAAKEEWLNKGDFWFGRNTIDFDISIDTGLKGYNRPVSLMNRLAVVLGNVNEGNIERLMQMIGDGMLCDSYADIEADFLANGTRLLTAHRGTTYYFISAKLIK